MIHSVDWASASYNNDHTKFQISIFNLNRTSVKEANEFGLGDTKERNEF